jgi:hypothetical protein
VPFLSWDLHLHPGPSNVPRWGGGSQIWEAARDAGVAGFVWKSHEFHTADRAAALPAGPPHAFGSASLNPWAGVEDVMAAIEAGARWVWGPTQNEALENAWRLPLPRIWNEVWPELVASGRKLVLAAAHLDFAGQQVVARACADVPHITCSITHGGFLVEDELAALAPTGCAFEFDCYTLTREVPGMKQGSLERLASAALERGNIAYLTSDAGQASTGNPFTFASGVLDEWRPELGDDLLEALSRTGPERLVQRALGIASPGPSAG